MLIFFLHHPLGFFCRNIIVAINIFHELVSSACLDMMKTSWGYCVSVFDSSGETAALLGIVDSGFLVGSGTEFEFGRIHQIV